MKKAITAIVILIAVIKIISATAFNDKDFYPNILIVNFDAKAINTTTGDIDIRKNEDLQVQIGLNSFDKIAREYNFIEMTRKYTVKNKAWHSENGAYPMNTFKIILKDNRDIENALSALKNDPNILFASYDSIMRTSYIPNDPLYPQQWHHPVIQSPLAWDHTVGDPTIVIGIVDSGMQWNHPDLRENIYINWAEMPGVEIDWEDGIIIGGDGIDNDGNGYIDDVLGWNFT